MQTSTPKIIFAPLFMGHTTSVAMPSGSPLSIYNDSQYCQVLSADDLLTVAAESTLMRGTNIFVLYLPPWHLVLNGDNGELAPSVDMAKAMEVWMVSVRRLLASRKVLKQKLSFIDVLGHDAESLAQHISSASDLDKNEVFDVLPHLLGALENRIAPSLVPALESFLREYFKELTALHDAVLPILEGGLESKLDSMSSPSEPSTKPLPLEALEALTEWYSAVYRSQIEQSKALEVQIRNSKEQFGTQSQRVQELEGRLNESDEKLSSLSQYKSEVEQKEQQLELKLKSAEEEAELLLMQLHQVQEELESYYLSNKDLKQILIQSTQTITRARRLAMAE